MKAITETVLRCELKNHRPEVYRVPDGHLLTPAAKEYLNQMKIDIAYESEKPSEEGTPEQKNEKKESEGEKEQAVIRYKPKYEDYMTGAGYMEKPEYMTQLAGNRLVDKNHGRIRFRGKLDTLQSLVVLIQASVCEKEKESLIKDLGDILKKLQEMMRCEVMEEPFNDEIIIGLDHDELRARSHNPMKYYNIQQMTLPNYGMGLTYALLNTLRANIREAEVIAVDAFMHDEKRMERLDIIQALNRMSSALHIMMCKYLAGEYS